MEIEWDKNNSPKSKLFGDIYFSNQQGVDESKYVFLQHNNLKERFSNLGDGDSFTIIETGFGTGLNFLTTWQLFNQIIQTTNKNTQLHFISIEKHPLKKEDLIKSLSLWPLLKNLANQLINSYPDQCFTGFNHQNFSHNKIKLTLIFDDVVKALNSINGKADAWFLDGFSPKKQP